MGTEVYTKITEEAKKVGYTGPMGDPKELVAGDLVGKRYRLEKVVGEGGFGVVYAATDTRTGNKVAVKVLTALDPSARTMFAQEQMIPQLFEGHGIVGILDSGDQDGNPYYVMPFLEGQSLHRARKGLSEQQKVNVLADALGTLGRVHQAGVVHRDLKPANIFLDDELNADIIDFGLAQLPRTYGAIDPGAGSGTPGFMPPEQAMGQHVGPQADVWAMGATAYELFAGHPPKKLPSGAPACPVFPLSFENPNVPKDFAGVVDRALECDPAKRYVNAADMLKYMTPYVQEAIRERETMRPAKLTETGIPGSGSLMPALVVAGIVALGIGGVAAVRRA